MTVKEQWRCLSRAEEIIAIHGAGVVNVLARKMFDASATLSLIEIFGPGYVINPYRKLAASLEFRYTAVRGHITPEVVRDLDIKSKPRSHSVADFSLSLNALMLALELSRSTSIEILDAAQIGLIARCAHRGARIP